MDMAVKEVGSSSPPVGASEEKAESAALISIQGKDLPVKNDCEGIETSNNSPKAIQRCSMDSVHRKLESDLLSTLNSKESLTLLSDKLMAAEVSTRLGDFYEAFDAIFQVANLYEECGDYEKSVFYLIRCLAIVKKTCNRLHESKVKLNLGRVCMKLHDTIKAKAALEQYLENVKIERDSEGVILGSKHLLEARACCKLGMIYYSQRQMESSTKYLEKFFRMACTLNDPKMIDAARINLGIVHSALELNSDAPENQTFLPPPHAID